jgi:ABC-type multidrug transport system fused ATPase/permease subunit
LAVELAPDRGLMHLLRRLWAHLARRRRWQLWMLLGMMVISALAEVVSVGAVLPFLSVLISPDQVFEYAAVRRLAGALGISTANDLAPVLTMAFVAVAIVAGAFRMFVLWLNTRLSFAIGKDLSIDCFRRTLYQPYHVHVSRNSSAVISGNVNKTSTVAVSVLFPLMMLLSQGLMLLAVVTALVAIDPVVAVASASVFGIGYGLFSLLSRRRLQSNSVRISQGLTEVLKSLQESLGSIRNILIDGTQPYYCEVFQAADGSLRRAQGSNTFISASPRFVMEALGMTALAILAFALSRRAGGIGQALPVLGALALGAQRLIPAMQQCFASWSSMVGNRAALVDTLALLDQPIAPRALEPPPPPLPFGREIRFDGVRFRYHADGPWVLDGLSFTIPKGARVGFVGPTGSGKTTVLDLMMGLLEPTEGQILVDGEPITGDQLRAWQRNIAHVPQTVYLADSTIAENIALGQPAELIDRARVAEVITMAQIADFVDANPLGPDAMVGERGGRLSGGQRQRIGIARALYRRGTVLVFDEATSALDSVTEQAVMDAIENLNRDLTVLLIAHRLTTVRTCDLILELADGRVKASGSYENLVKNSHTFRAMADAGQQPSGSHF